MGDNASDLFSCAMTTLSAFYESIDVSALDTAIRLHREALTLRASTDPNTWRSLFEISDALLIRVSLIKGGDDLEEGITLRRKIRVAQPNRILHLCAALLTGSKLLEVPNDWQRLLEAAHLFAEAMRLQIEAVESVQTGSNLLQVFGQSGNRSDLDTAISALEKADHHMSWERGVVATNMAVCLRERFALTDGR